MFSSAGSVGISWYHCGPYLRTVQCYRLEMTDRVGRRKEISQRSEPWDYPFFRVLRTNFTGLLVSNRKRELRSVSCFQPLTVDWREPEAVAALTRRARSQVRALSKKPRGNIIRDDMAPRGFYEGLSARSLMAGWARGEQPIGSKSEMHVHVWWAAEARAALQEASRFVGAMSLNGAISSY